LSDLYIQRALLTDASILAQKRQNLHDYPVHKKVYPWGVGLPLYLKS